MSSWPKAALGEICEIQRGGSPRPIDHYITEDIDGINWIKIGDVAQGAKYIHGTKEKIRPEGAVRSRRVEAGDFLLTNSMSFGRPYILRTSGCIHDGWLQLRYDKSRVVEDYLYHALSSDAVYAQFTKYASGAVVKNLNCDVVRRVTIPLPSIAEQRRIAAILDQADALRAKRREALRELDRLTQSVYFEMFGDPVTNLNRYQTRKLAEIVDPLRPLTYGILMPGAHVEDGVRYVRVVDMKKGQIQVEGIKRTTPQISNAYRRSLLHAGDLLISIRGHVGRLASIPSALEGANITQDSARIAVREANPIFVRECLRTPGFQRWMARHTKGVAVRGINLGDLKLMPIPLPTRVEQDVFSAKTDAIEQLAKLQQRSLEEADKFFASLQQSIFPNV